MVCILTRCLFGEQCMSHFYTITITSQTPFSLEIGWAGALLIILVLGFIYRTIFTNKELEVVEMNIPLGNVGVVKLKPNYEDIQMAHKLWTQLVTRKAAIPIDPELDVIVEIYDSWYAMFNVTRTLISEIPANRIRDNDNTRKLVNIATTTLNDGLRPHLTTWQAKFRNWYKHQEAKLATQSPQEVQKEFDGYDELVADMLLINGQLREYAAQLLKFTGGK